MDASCHVRPAPDRSRVHALDHTGGELAGDAFSRISPFHQAPVIDDDGFVVSEFAGRGALPGREGRSGSPAPISRWPTSSWPPSWAPIRKTDLMEPYPRIKAFYARIHARPAWQRTLGLYAERVGVSVDEIR